MFQIPLILATFLNTICHVFFSCVESFEHRHKHRHQLTQYTTPVGMMSPEPIYAR